MLGLDLVPRLAGQFAGQVRHLPLSARELLVLRRAGLTPLSRPDEIGYGLLTTTLWGVVPGAVKVAARREPSGIGLVDDKGPLTFGQLDRRSNAVARAWRDRGLDAGSTIALLCRNHRGLVDALLAAGKVGATVLLLETGLAGPQLASVGARERIDAVVYDEEFAGRLGDLPPSASRFLAWTDGSAADAERLEDLVENTSDAGLPRPPRPGALVLLTGGSTGTPKAVVRRVADPLVATQLLDRIPLRGGQHAVLATPLSYPTASSSSSSPWRSGRRRSWAAASIPRPRCGCWRGTARRRSSSCRMGWSASWRSPTRRCAATTPQRCGSWSAAGRRWCRRSATGRRTCSARSSTASTPPPRSGW